MKMSIIQEFNYALETSSTIRTLTYLLLILSVLTVIVCLHTLYRKHRTRIKCQKIEEKRVYEIASIFLSKEEREQFLQ